MIFQFLPRIFAFQRILSHLVDVNGVTDLGKQILIYINHFLKFAFEIPSDTLYFDIYVV
jgi:hypothetical protein